MKTLEDKLIGFCICTNSEEALEECSYYINRLNVPKGYRVEVTPVWKAGSMAEGYNSFMNESSARYKIYMHQDVIILNRDFLLRMLEVFSSDESIGMLGVLGSTETVEDAVYYNKWNVGYVEACFTGGIFRRNLGDSLFEDNNYCEVKAIDGMLMATCVDIPWREDLDIKWDFYDITQSVEFIKAGYKIVVPRQDYSWTFHDCGVSKLSDYERCRKIVMEAYPDVFFAEYESENNDLIFQERNKLFEMILSLYESAQYATFCEVAGYLMKNGAANLNTDSWYLVLMAEIFEAELKADEKGSFVGNGKTFEENRKLFIDLKRLLRKIEVEPTAENMDSMLSFAKKNRLSRYAILTVGAHSLPLWKETVVKIQEHMATLSS